MSSFSSRPSLPGLGFSVAPGEEVPGFRVDPRDAEPDAEFQQVKDPIRCSGPNSACEEWGNYKRRPTGVYKDIENPPFRLCPDCFRKSYGRPGKGDDTHLILPEIMRKPDGAG